MKGRPVTVHLADLVGRRVYARDGTVVGHIEEIRGERHDAQIEVTEFHLGRAALAERLSLGWGRRARLTIVRWDQLDFTDPQAPTLTCDLDALEKKRLT